MTGTPTLPPVEAGDELTLAQYAQRAYLEYALSVVKGRALPDVADGQKRVVSDVLAWRRTLRCATR